MFDLSFEKLFVLVVAALFVLGPERLPAAAAWLGQTARKVKNYAADADRQLRRELGPEFDQLREPLRQLRAPLQELRTLRDPRTAILQHLLTDPAPTPATDPATDGPPGPTRRPTTPANPAPVPVPVYDHDAT